ncbi:MAG: raxB [Gemmatimonadetes bacterium]|nr:raxB [Gemmatimonadota bacterium]
MVGAHGCGECEGRGIVTPRDADCRLHAVAAVRQSGPADCGLVALEMVLEYHGGVDVRSALRRILGYSQAGTTVHAIVGAARTCGFDADAFSVTVSELSDVPLPAILHWRRSHYVVLEGSRGDRYCVVDPARGRRLIDPKEMQRYFSGIAIGIEPITTPRDASSRSRVVGGALRQVTKARDWVALGVLMSLGIITFVLFAGAAGSLAESVFTGRANVTSAFYVLVCAVLLWRIAKGLTRLDQQAVNRIGSGISTQFVNGLQQAEQGFLVSRTERYLEYTGSEADPLFNVEFPHPVRVGYATAIPVMILVVAQRSIRTAGVLLLGSALLAGWDALPWRLRIQKDRTHLYSARELLRAILHRPQDLLAAGLFGEALRRFLREREYASAADEVGPAALVLPFGVELGVVLTLVLATVAVELGRQRLSISGAVETQLLSIAVLLVSSSTRLELLRLRAWRRCVERVTDLGRERSADVLEDHEILSSVIAPVPLLECQALSYGDMDNAQRWLHSVSFAIEPGESLALIGASGSGKTLMSELLLGLRRASCGFVRVSGETIRLLPESRRRSMIAGALEDAMPMDGSLGDFFRTGSSLSDQGIWSACGVVGLDKWLGSLPMGLQTPLTRALPGFASHQRRLVCIARLLIEPPRILVVDATLDSLDQPRAHRIAGALGSHVDAVVLLTARPEIVPDNYRRLYIIDGRLRSTSDSRA